MSNLDLARRVIEQWENHGQYRDFEKAGEPIEVKLARTLLRQNERFQKQCEYGGILSSFLFALAKGRPLPDKGHDLYARTLAQEALDKAAKMQATIDKAREDINWMLNNRQFLNADVFEYLAAEKFA